MLEQRKKIMAVVLAAAVTGTAVSPAEVFAQIAEKVPAVRSFMAASSSDAGLGSSSDWSEDTDREDWDEADVWQEVPKATMSDALPYGLTEGSFESRDGIYTFEAEYFYTDAEPAADGQAANLQPHTQIEIPLEAVEGFSKGQYLVEVMYAGNGQMLTAASGGKSAVVTCPDTGFDWERKTVSVGDRLMGLDGTGSLTLKAGSDGKYGWVDWIRLTPVNGVLLDAKDYVTPADKLTGDGNSCANMDPGVSLEIPLDHRFGGASYELQMWT